MSFYLDENFDESYLRIVADVKSEEYYINMMRAWYFATALAKQHEKTLPYIKNRAIQKATESRRVSKEQKEYLKTLKLR